MNRATLFGGALMSGLMASDAPAFAQDDPQVDCANAQTQMEMTFCANEDYGVADTELNVAYKATMAAMKTKDKELGEIEPDYVGAVEALKTAQRAWIAYRDGQCELAGFEARGGTMEPMLVALCLADLTRKRTAELKAVTEGPEN